MPARVRQPSAWVGASLPLRHAGALPLFRAALRPSRRPWRRASALAPAPSASARSPAAWQGWRFAPAPS
eukprot:7476626-Alexandrium_andersonii.AAC.1